MTHHTPSAAAPTWVPESCTLPTVEQPLRVREFDDLFTGSLRTIERPGPTTARLTLATAEPAQVRDLVDREVGCCSFFTFTLTPEPDGLSLGIDVPATRVPVLDALVGRAATLAGLPR
ncbi:hypothetical protein [Granulicoccus phenolivorans]|uniref:hypothetical protein n=1 Tax=Granulicoccus phenolivorans TaxID=266854 RepID=UPI00040E7730|nr:hypothetical protein [Granulicoccus phenolivorans]